jgi:hypothetical protein
MIYHICFIELFIYAFMISLDMNDSEESINKPLNSENASAMSTFEIHESTTDRYRRLKENLRLTVELKRMILNILIASIRIGYVPLTFEHKKVISIQIVDFKQCVIA